MPIELLRSDVVYRNPKPHLYARHAWHPTLVNLGGARRCATFDIGQAAESLDYATYISFSEDEGRRWSEPAPLLPQGPSEGPTTHTMRLTRLADGQLVAWGARFDRHRTEEGLTNRENLGFVPMDLLLTRSDDAGRTWEPPRTIEPSIVGPAFEVCHSIVELPDGRWIGPTSTWRGWDGECPNGMKAVLLVSADRGQTWPTSIDVMDGSDRGVLHLEQSVIPWGDRGLLAVAWAFDERTGNSLPLRFAVAEDGERFGGARQTDLQGETAKIVRLSAGRVLCVYRRIDRPGLWAAVAEVTADSWRTVEQVPLWSGASSSMAGAATASDGLAELKFGYPSICVSDDERIQVAFWCRENEVGLIRMFTLEAE